MPINSSAPGHHKTTRASERAEKALALRSEYKTFRAIGEELGVSHTTAREYVLQAVEAAKERIAHMGEHLRAEEAAKVDRMSIIYGEKALEGNIKAAEMWLKLRTRYAQLCGLDKQLPRPKDAEVEVTLVGWQPPPTATTEEADALRSVVRKISEARGTPVDVRDENGGSVPAELVSGGDEDS